jgi:hypothetical protein
MDKMRNIHKTLAAISERKRPLGKLRHRWEDNIMIDIREKWWKGVHCVHLAQVREK